MEGRSALLNQRVACGVVIYSGAQKPLRVKEAPNPFAGGEIVTKRNARRCSNGYRIDGSAVSRDYPSAASCAKALNWSWLAGL